MNCPSRISARARMSLGDVGWSGETFLSTVVIVCLKAACSGRPRVRERCRQFRRPERPRGGGDLLLEGRVGITSTQHRVDGLAVRLRGQEPRHLPLGYCLGIGRRHPHLVAARGGGDLVRDGLAEGDHLRVGGVEQPLGDLVAHPGGLVGGEGSRHVAVHLAARMRLRVVAGQGAVVELLARPQLLGVLEDEPHGTRRKRLAGTDRVGQSRVELGADALAVLGPERGDEAGHHVLVLGLAQAHRVAEPLHRLAAGRETLAVQAGSGAVELEPVGVARERLRAEILDRDDHRWPPGLRRACWAG